MTGKEFLERMKKGEFAKPKTDPYGVDGPGALDKIAELVDEGKLVINSRDPRARPIAIKIK